MLSLIYEASRERLQQWLNKSMKIEMSDGRTLIGTFLCTDRDQNVILGSCSEFLKPEGADRCAHAI
ncbi:LSM domain-containing protein, putative [Ixodes scapularis]|uniref:LSM domain-containing protein, putative n=1 Tax=Ixodes scapularis TaxID=6945 RepID=B7Q916_IXOSC|nr:LSM domain-containing protein, putative [Ixodes scapularis]|eukprot:XP_002412445.1 LSM domain-containing protein, putative [Ixodes scapularis]